MGVDRPLRRKAGSAQRLDVQVAMEDGAVSTGGAVQVGLTLAAADSIVRCSPGLGGPWPGRNWISRLSGLPRNTLPTPLFSRIENRTYASPPNRNRDVVRSATVVMLSMQQ